jgi:hypothetical protein
VRGGVSSVLSHEQAFALLGNTVRAQARLISYLDVFWVFWVLTFLALPLIFLMKRSVAQGGAAMH